MPRSSFPEFSCSGQTVVTEGKGKHVRTTKPFSVRQCFSDSDAYFTISVSKLRQICLMETFYLVFFSFLIRFKNKILSIIKW